MSPLVVPAIASALQAGYGIYRGIKSDKALKELQKQRMARYMDAAGPLQQNLAMAQRQAQMGLSPQARALATGTAAAQTASQYRAATDLAGGQLGSAIGRIGAFNTNQLGLSLGAQSQAARERGMGQMMNINAQLSALQQRDVAQDINYRIMLEQNYGQAKQQAISDVMGAVTGFGMAAMSSANAAQDRQLYRDMYGVGDQTSSMQPIEIASKGISKFKTPDFTPKASTPVSLTFPSQGIKQLPATTPTPAQRINFTPSYRNMRPPLYNPDEYLY